MKAECNFYNRNVAMTKTILKLRNFVFVQNYEQPNAFLVQHV